MDHNMLIFLLFFLIIFEKFSNVRGIWPRTPQSDDPQTLDFKNPPRTKILATPLAHPTLHNMNNHITTCRHLRECAVWVWCDYVRYMLCTVCCLVFPESTLVKHLGESVELDCLDAFGHTAAAETGYLFLPTWIFNRENTVSPSEHIQVLFPIFSFNYRLE